MNKGGRRGRKNQKISCKELLQHANQKERANERKVEKDYMGPFDGAAMSVPCFFAK